MNKSLLTMIVLLIIAVGIAWYTKTQQAPTVVITPQPSASPVATPQPTNSPPADDLGQGGSSYMDPDGVFTLLYPSDYIVDSPAENHVRIFKRAETERPQGEISDGAMVVIEQINLEGKTLEEYVDERIATATADGAAELVAPKTSTTLNSYSGFTYTVRGQGATPQIAVQKDSNSDFAVVITTLVEDPQNLGYQAEIDATLSTLQLLK